MGAILVKVIHYMMGSKKEIVSAIKSSTIHTNIVSESLNKAALSLARINQTLISLDKVDERIAEPQAVIIYGLIMRDTFYDIKQCFKDTNSWLNDKEYDRDDDDVQIRIAERVELCFDAIYNELDDRLKNFKYNDNYLDKYLNDKFQQEFSHVKNHIYAMLCENTNGINSYITQKKSFLISNFNGYLRSNR
jgi:hypothetical protein